MQCSEKIAGTNDETITGTARLFMPGGTQAAADAEVMVYKSGDTSKIPGYIAQTDADGRYVIKDLPDGIYNILSEKDSLIAFQDSLYVINGKGLFNNDTLEKQGTLTGWIKVQPNDDSRNVVVNITGTNIWSNVDKNGKFTLNRIATGNYTLVLIVYHSQMSGYVTTFYPVSAQGGVDDTIRTPLEVMYTGIPVITGLTGLYDSLNGVVKLSWNKPAYDRIKEYVIYRAEIIKGVETNYWRHAITNDTTFYDTITMDPSLQSQTFEYYVIIKNHKLEEGAINDFYKIETVNSEHVRSLFHTDTMTAFLNIPCTLSTRVSSYYGSSVSYEWDIGCTGNFISGGSDTVITFTDFSRDGLICICKVTGNESRVTIDTLIIKSGLMIRKIESPFEFIQYAYQSKDSIYVIDYDNNIWVSSDASNWKKTTKNIPFVLSAFDYSVTNDVSIR